MSSTINIIDSDKMEMLFKFELLQKSYKLDDIPKFTIHSDYNQMKETYETILRTLASKIDNSPIECLLNFYFPYQPELVSDMLEIANDVLGCQHESLSQLVKFNPITDDSLKKEIAVRFEAKILERTIEHCQQK